MAETVISTIRLQGKPSIRFEHPRDATDEQIQAMTHDIVSQAYPEFVTPEAQIERPKPESFTQGVIEGVRKPIDNAARFLEAGADQFGVGGAISDLSRSMGMPGTVDEGAAIAQAQSDASPTQGSAAGNFVGNIAGTLPTLALPGGALVQGAAGGALLTDKRDAFGVAKDAGIGALTSVAGGALMRGAGALANPNVPNDIRTLINAGVRNITPGQYGRAAGTRVGEMVARTEDRAVSTPFVGDAIVNGRNRSMDEFGQAAINRSLAPIGETLPANMGTGRAAIRHAGDRLSAAYNRTTANIGEFATDQQFIDDLAAIQQNATEMLPARAEQLNNIFNGLGRFFRNNGTTLDGASLKSIETRLGDRIRRLSRSTDADQQELGDALDAARSAVRDLAARAHPDLADELGRINQGWASLVQVEKASLNSRGRITPAGYSQAVRQGSNTVRGRGYARGQALNQDLSDAASNVLPSEIADSGTAGRWQQSNLLANAIGAAQVPANMAARGVTRALTRNDHFSPGLQRLLEYGARGVPVLAPSLLQGSGN